MLDNFISRHTPRRGASMVNQRPKAEVFYRRPKGPISDFITSPRAAAPAIQEPVIEEVLESEVSMDIDTPADYHAYHIDDIFVRLAAIEAEDVSYGEVQD